MTTEEFGRTIKQKYPQYQSQSDADVGNAMLQKYPQYQSQITTSTGIPTQDPTHSSFMDKLHSVLNTSASTIKNVDIGVVKGGAGTIKKIGDLGEKALAESAGRAANLLTGKGVVPTQTNETTDIGQTVNKKIQAVGMAQKIGKTIEQAGEFLIPGGAEADVVKTADKAIEGLNVGSKIAEGLLKVGTRAATSATTNAGIVAAQGRSGKDIKTAGAVGAIAGAVSKPIQDILSKLPESAWSNILKRTSSAVSKNPDLPSQAAETGMVGTKQSIANQSQQAIQHIEMSLNDVLKNSPEKIDGGKIASYLKDLKASYTNIPGEAHSVAVIDGIQQDLADKGQMSLSDANQLKRDIYGLISKSYGKGTLEVPAKTEAQKIAASGIKQEIEKAVPEAKTLNQKQSVYIQIKKAIDRQLTLGEGKGIAGTHIGMYDLLTGGLGELAGASSGHPILGPLIAVGAKKTAESAITQSTVAKMVTYFNQLSPTQKLLFYNGLKGLSTKAVNSISSNKQP